MKDYYKTLEVSHNASYEKIKEQRNFLIQAWHPDKFPTAEQKLKATEKAREINEAYAVLRDPEKRRRYDEERSRFETQEESVYYREEQERKRREQAEADQSRATYERQQKERGEAERRRADFERHERAQADVRRQSEAKAPKMFDLLMGVLTLKAPVYNEIAHDKSATTTAGIITVVMAVLGGILGALAVSVAGSSLPPDQLAQMGSPMRIVVSTIINTIVGWVVGSAVFGFVANMFGGKTDTGEMLRVFGFAQIFQVLNVIPCIGTIAALVLSVVGAVIGIREADGFSTGKALLTGVVGFFALFIVSIVIGVFMAIIGL